MQSAAPSSPGSGDPDRAIRPTRQEIAIATGFERQSYDSSLTRF